MEENQPKPPSNIVLSRSAGHELPQHIVEEIVVRLPVKSIVRFTSVSRQWFNMISDLDLLEVNFQQSISKLRMVLRIRNAQTDECSYCSFKFDEEGMKVKKVATLCSQDVSDSYNPINASCKGLLLFEGYGKKLYVYDTIRQKQKLLPKIEGGWDELESYAMVYDASKRKYKVVAFFYDQFHASMKLLFYDLNPRKWWRKGKWRESKPPLAQIVYSHSSVLLQGVFYWIAEPCFPLHNFFIQPMEVATERYMERIEAPCQPFHGSLGNYELLEMKGSLCLVQAASDEELNIWALKDSVKSFWIKQYTIFLSSVVHRPSLVNGFLIYPFFRPRLIVGTYLLVTNAWRLYWYNMDTKEMSQIEEEHMEENQPKRAKPNGIVLSGRGGHDHELPQHIVEDIIVMLPAKSIVRFKSVCRQWFNMISDLDLPDVNFQQSISKLRIVCQTMKPPNRRRIAHDHDQRSYCSFKLDDGGMKAKKVATLRLQHANNYCHLSNLSCNSLLVFEGDGEQLYVYETITQQQKLLPKIPDYYEGDFFSIVYDASKLNYKVVVFAYEIQGMKLLFYDLNPRKWWRKGKWRKSKPPLAETIQIDSLIVVQGALYWTAEPVDESDDTLIDDWFIQGMEITTEKFMERIAAPCQPAEGSCTYDLLEMKGSLCLVNAASDEEITIWVLKDAAQSFWLKQYNIALSSLVPPLSSNYRFLRNRSLPNSVSFYPRLIVENRVLVVIGQGLCWYNMDTEELSKITMEAHPNCNLIESCIIKY